MAIFPYDTSIDPFIDALALVVPAYVNEKLVLPDDDLGNEYKAIRAVYPHRIALNAIPSVKTPALAISRHEMQHRAHGPIRTWWDTTLRFEYFAPPCPLSALPDRWPLVENCWLELWDGMTKDTYQGQKLITQSGVKWLYPNQSKVQFLYAEATDYVWAMFSATVKVAWELVVVQEYVDARELLCRQLRDDMTAVLVTSLHKTELALEEEAAAEEAFT